MNLNTPEVADAAVETPVDEEAAFANTFKQDGLYLRDGELWVNPSAEPFFSIQDALDFIPLENICGVLLPSGEVYL